MKNLNRLFEGLSFRWNEWTGSFGDLGTFIPLFLGLALTTGLPPGKTLILVGCFYITTAFVFKLPIPVQPLQAMAAIVMAKKLGLPLLEAAGIEMGILLLIFGFTKAAAWMGKLFDRTMIKGIQFGVGLMLMEAGLRFMLHPSPMEISHPLAHSFFLPDWHLFLPAFFLLVLPQIPLTLGNAVYATSDLAHEYFKEKAEKATPKNLLLSLGFANIAMGGMNGMPVCHGSEGLTGHYRFGARTGGATIILGSLFIAVGLFYPQQIYPLLSQIPQMILGASLFYIGICHAWLIHGTEEKRWIAVLMGLVALGTSNLSYSLFFGLAAEYLPLLFLKKEYQR